MGEILLILGLILLNGLFSMAEIALVSARKARLEAQANKGDKKAKEALELSNHPDTFLSTVQIGITLIGILTGILSGENLKANFAAFLKRSNPSPTTVMALPRPSSLSSSLIFRWCWENLFPKRLGLARPETIAKVLGQADARAQP